MSGFREIVFRIGPCPQLPAISQTTEMVGLISIFFRVAIKVHSHWENQNKYRRGPSIPRKKSATFFYREMSRFGIQLALA